MSFFVEIPSVFTKATQIPVRLGNTILSGNETIQGSLSVNGSLILNSGDSVDNTNVVYYDSLDISNSLSVGGNVSISGDLVVGDVNVEEKFDEIDATTTSNANNLGSIQTQVNALINFTGGGVNFRAYNVSNSSVSATQNLPYLTVDYDTDSGYNNTNYIYTIPIDGTYIFTFGWYVNGTTAVVNLIRKRGATETIIQQSTNGTNQSFNSAFVGTTISECLQSDEIYVYLESGTLILNYGVTTETGASFSGARLSN